MKLRECPFCGKPIHEYGYAGRGEYITRLELFCPTCHVDISLDTGFYTDAKIAVDGTVMTAGGDCVAIWNSRNPFVL